MTSTAKQSSCRKAASSRYAPAKPRALEPKARQRRTRPRGLEAIYSSSFGFQVKIELLWRAHVVKTVELT